MKNCHRTALRIQYLQQYQEGTYYASSLSIIDELDRAIRSSGGKQSIDWDRYALIMLKNPWLFLKIHWLYPYWEDWNDLSVKILYSHQKRIWKRECRKRAKFAKGLIKRCDFLYHTLITCMIEDVERSN